MKNLILCMGPPGVGKKKIINYILKKFSGGICLIKDDIFKTNCHLESKELKQFYYNKINKELSRNKYVIILDNNIFEKERKELFDNLKNLNNINIIGIGIENSYYICKRNLSNSTYNLKEFNYLFNYRCSPRVTEPFNNILYINMITNLGISKKYPYLNDINTTLNKIFDKD